MRGWAGWGAGRAAWGAAWGDALHARVAGRARLGPSPFAPPEPRLQGDPERGRRLLAGRVRLGAEVLEAQGRSPWDLGAPGDPAAAGLHAWAWLDDLAALGTAPARAAAQAWVADWTRRYGRGAGPGWTAEIAADRLLRLVAHGGFLLRGAAPGAADRLGAAAARHALFLGRRWRRAAPGRPRLAALAALVQAGLAMPSLAGRGRAALEAMGAEAAASVDDGGALSSRNPEELLDCLWLLTWTAEAAASAGLSPAPGHAGAIARAAPTLRALRHADGGLARFHGGDRGAEGRLDATLAAAGRPGLGAARPGARSGARAGARSDARPGPRAAELHMGYARLAAGRTTVVVDAAAPPGGAASAGAHASTLALELTSGRRPLVVSCGPGRGFGPDWRRAARATASHSTLAIEGFSSARLAPADRRGGAERLADAPARVIAEASPLAGGRRVELAHDGWRRTHGLTHARTLELSADGRALGGEDLLTTLTAADARAFDRAQDGGDGLGIPFAIRFHLHPDVEAEVAADAGAARLGLPSGEEWVLAVEDGARLVLEPSVHLEEGRLWPRPALQVVASGRALSYATRVRWRLAKAQGVPAGLRDLAPGREAGEDGEDDEA